MKFLVKTIIEAPDVASAIALRGEMVGAIEDAHERRDPGSADVGELIEIEDERTLAIIELARERHCRDTSCEIEADDNAILSEGSDGAWVQGRLFVPNEVLDEHSLRSPEFADIQED